MSLIADVAALYIDPRGPYPKLLVPENCYDEARDARTYAGPWPVVAHPPCGPWSALRHLHSRPEERELGRLAVELVRRWGGVLEQPRGSLLWSACDLPCPNARLVAGHHEFAIEVEQCAWGHVARKKTWLLFVGVDFTDVWSTRREGGAPTHWVSGGRTQSSRRGSPVPPGIKVCSAQQRRRTPPAFASWLISLARQARIPLSLRVAEGAGK